MRPPRRQIFNHDELLTTDYPESLCYRSRVRSTVSIQLFQNRLDVRFHCYL
jgi:hypothetical protein